MEENKSKFQIGYTTGVFDMFHIGHLNILKRAKEYCNYLIVGVSTDEVVEKYKFHKPVIPFEERIEIVRAIKYVDEVVVQDTMDKLVAYEKYHFNVLFHGDDWKGNEYYNIITQELEKRNVEMVYFPYTKRTSSTELRNYIMKNQ